MRKFRAIILITLLCTILVGCTKYDNGTTTALTNEFSGAYDKSVAIENAEYSDYSSSEDMSNADIVKSNMMVVRNADISVDVKNLEEFTGNLTKKVTDLGGYFEDSSINNYEQEWSTTRYGYYTIRIPAENLDTFLTYTEDFCSITQKTISVEDVSLEYVDVEAHINALEQERDHLQSLLDSAANVTEIMEIADRLTSVQAQLDSYTSQKKLLENRVTYSTVKLNACENREVDHPIRAAFNVQFKEVMLEGLENAVNVFVGIIAAIPVIIIITAFVVLFIWILRKILPKIFKKKHNKYSYKYMFMPVALDEEYNSEEIRLQNLVKKVETSREEGYGLYDARKSKKEEEKN